MQSSDTGSNGDFYLSHVDPGRTANNNVSSRAKAIKELVTIQMAFAKDMHHLHQALENVQQSALSTEDRQNVISSLPTLSRLAGEITRSWLNELDRVDCLAEAQIAITFLPFKDRISEALQTYALTYEANENPSLEVTAYLESALKELQKVKPNVSILEGELIKPVQWLFRYQQLFENILKHTPASHADYQASVEVIDHFTSFTRIVNEKKRWNELRSQAFEEPKGKAALFKRACQLMKYSKQKSTDPDFERERVALMNLRNFCEKMHTWAKEYFNMKRAYLRADREFLVSIMNACNVSGFLQIVPISGSPKAMEPRVNMHNQLQPYKDIIQNTLTYLSYETIPDLETKVLNRLSNLIHYLEDPERLVKLYLKTVQNLDSVLAQIDTAIERNQPTIGLVEKRDSMNSTISTLYSGLMNQIPKLRATAERLLLHALMYVFLLDRNLSNHHSSHMTSQLQCNQTTISIPTGTHESLLHIIEEMVNRVNDKPTHHARIIIPKLFKTPPATPKYGFDLFSDQGPVSRLLQINNTKPEVGSSIKSLENQDTRVKLLPNSQSFSDKSDLLGFGAAPRSPRISQVLLHDGNLQPLRGQVVTSNDLTPSVPRRRRGRKMNTLALPLDRSREDDQPHQGATHRAAYSFYKQSDEQVTMYAGQYVNVVRPFDSVGNSQWCFVEILPGRERGYVPANRLSSLNH